MKMGDDIIDRKFEFKAVNPCNGKEYDHHNAIVFVAKDLALVPTLKFYRDQCEYLGSTKYHLESLDLLIERVKKFQQSIGAKVPDTDLSCEIKRCIHGETE